MAMTVSKTNAMKCDPFGWTYLESVEGRVVFDSKDMIVNRKEITVGWHQMGQM